jgi:ATP-dependent Clp protease ATP-binding subunit ClpC
MAVSYDPSSGSEPDPQTLRMQAEQLAAKQHAEPTTIHLLAAIAGSNSLVAGLLRERGLSEQVILSFRTAQDESEPLKTFVNRGREIARRMGVRVPLATHLLIAVLNDAGSRGRKALVKAGCDVGRLRTHSMNLGLGLVNRRRPERERSAEAPRVASAPPRGVAIPIFPPPPKVTPSVAPAELPAPEAAASTPAPSSAEAPRKAANGSRSERVPAIHRALSPYELDPKKFPTLTGFGQNLTLLAARGELEPIVGREPEIEQVLDILAKRHGNNPCLVGAAGVGKTSVARGLAHALLKSATLPDASKILIEIPMTEFLLGTGVRGALAARFSTLRKELLAAEGRVIVFVDDVGQLFHGDGADEIAADLRQGLSRGELSLVGAATHEAFRRTIDADPVLSRRFTAVEVEEPSREDAFLILESVSKHYARHHQVRYDESALATAIAWSVRYLPGRALPDKAVGIVDLAGARAKRRGQPEVGVESIAEVVAGLACFPVERLLESDADRMLRFEQLMAERVVGHGREIERIGRILRRNAAGMGSRRPIGTFLLLGPTGVGKTETAKAIAEVLFHSDQAMTRIDLSEYSEAHSTAKLIGAPPGYVGYEAGGQLTEAVRRRPYQVVLLDEVEKAHPEVLTTFLAVFDEGRMTDGRGRTVDFTNTVILLTSNLGSGEVQASARRRVGFGADAPAASDLCKRMAAVARDELAPELYNRIDEVLVFLPLERAEVREIARRMLAGLGATLGLERGVSLDVGDDAIDYLLEHGGYDPALGARPMRRTLARLVEAPLAEKILKGEVSRGDLVLLGVDGDELSLDVVEAAERTKFAAPAAE